MRFTFVDLIFYLYLCKNKIIKMDIGSKSGYPSSSLSNFAGHRFIFEDVKSETVLTESEFCKRLTLLRNNGKIESRYPDNDWRTISVKLERPSIEQIIFLEL